MGKLDQRIQRALALHQSGDLVNAQQEYERLIAKHPNDAALQYLLGTLYYQQGQLSQSERLLARSLKKDPKRSDAHRNYSLVLLDLGRQMEARSHAERAARLAPNDAQTHANLGLVLNDEGDFVAAVKSLERAAALDPVDEGIRTNLGISQAGAGDFSAAEQSFKSALEIAPNYGLALRNLGVLLFKKNRFAEALLYLEQAVASLPDDSEIRIKLAFAYTRGGQARRAVTEAKGLLQSGVKGKQILFDLGVLLIDNNLAAEALVVAQILRNTVDQLGYIGATLELRSCQAYGMEKYGRKMATHLASQPNEQPLAAYTRGLWEFSRNNVETAVVAYQVALAKQPDARAHFNLGLCYLLIGDLKRGFDEYQWRFHPDGGIGPHGYTQPEWNGEPLNGRTLLVHSEQGAGDIIQFMRYMRHVHERGGQIEFASPKVVWDLLTTQELGEDDDTEAQVPGDESAKEVVQIPILNLPAVVGTTIDTIPWDGAYVHAGPTRKRQWLEQMEAANKLRVGVVWAGSPLHKNDRNRSCRFDDFAGLADIPGICWLSLQKGAGEIQAKSAPPEMDVKILSEKISDFADTAAIVANLDLVVVVDTSVAHLAGAMAARVWTLLPYHPDWRWLLDRDDTPWYPSMRLFRQPYFGDWGGLFGKVREALVNEVVLHGGKLHVADQSRLAAYQAQQAGDHAQAVQYLRDALHRAGERELPDVAYAVRRFALATGHGGVLEEDLRSFSDTASLHALATVRRVSGDNAAAPSLLEALLERPDVSWAAFHELATLFTEHNDFRLAETVCTKGLQVFPDCMELMCLLATVHHESGHYEEAARHLEIIVERDPTNIKALRMAASNFEKLGNTSGEVEAWQRLISLRPRDVNAWARLEHWFADQGHGEVAAIIGEHLSDLRSWQENATIAQ